MSYLSCYFPGILRDSGLYYKLEKLVKDSVFVIYGDPAYPLRRLIQKLYGGAVLSPDQIAFNRRMSTVRQAVEWGYGKVAAEFVFVDFNIKSENSSPKGSYVLQGSNYFGQLPHVPVWESGNTFFQLRPALHSAVPDFSSALAIFKETAYLLCM